MTGVMTRVLLAPDSFKGSLRAAQVAAHLAAGVRACAPGVEVDQLPVADGGEGTVDAALAAGYEPVELRATGPLGEPVTARYARQGTTAVVELAAVSGLEQVERPDPATALAATSRGLGELIAHALAAGARTVVIGVGGSACTDGGAGMLAALGARIHGPDGELPDGGGALRDVTAVDLSGLDPALKEAQLVLAGDVDNPLLGERGAAAVYGPQKGADPATVTALEDGLGRWVGALAADGTDRARLATAPGAGAAGGAGYACLLLGATRRPGIEVVLELTGFAERAAGVDLVVTGEGSLDAQSLHGKTPVGVAAAAAAAGAPTVAVCGRSTLQPAEAARAGIRAVYPLTDLEPDPARCIADAGPLLERLAKRIVAEQLTATPADPGSAR